MLKQNLEITKYNLEIFRQNFMWKHRKMWNIGLWFAGAFPNSKLANKIWLFTLPF